MAIYKRRTTFLVSGEHSPVPLEERQRGFKGCEFFPIDMKYQFKLELQEYENPERVSISLSNGELVESLRVGFLEFEIEGKKQVLNVYKKRVEDTEIFVPFKDRTSGKETYGGGRYVDVELDPSGDTCVLDFNLSGNPLCAFAEGKYDCPIPPRENWLDVEIRAGEKKYEGSDRKPRGRTV